MLEFGPAGHAARSMTRLHLALLGSFDARLDPGGRLTLARQKVAALLAFLASTPGRLHRRDTLAALLWADAPGPRARQSLRTALAELRLALAPVSSCLIERGDAVGLDSDAVDVDVARFEALLANGGPAALEQAAGIYRGELLEGLRVAEAPFEEWLMAERERLRELALEALARILAGHIRADALAQAVQTALRLVALDPLQETVHRTLMRLYLRLGRRGAGLRQYQACLDALRRELGAEPEAETRALYLELLQSASSPAPPEAAMASPGLAEAPAVYPAPLVGRASDLARLGQAYEAARRGGPPVLALIGEAGIGKTRLLDELVATLSPQDARVVVGRAYETESQLPFGVWIHTLRERGVLSDIRRHVERHRTRLGELARLLPELASLEAEPAGVTTDPGRLFEALSEVVRELARSGLLLVLEDLHWADDSSLRFLAFLARRVEGASVAIVVSAREEELAGSPLLQQVLAELEREGRGVKIRLTPLSHEATVALVRALARAGTDPASLERLGEEMWRVSEGYPFMVVESMRALAEGGTTAAVAGLPLPERVRDTIVGRLERLPERARRLMSVAAAVGQEFEFRVLQHAGGLEATEAAEAVEELVARRILHAVGERLDFTHDWIRRAAHDRVISPARPALHDAIGRALETLYADRLDEVADRLAHHYAQAGDAPKAVRYLRRLADAAGRRYAIADAIRILRQALEHVARLPVADRARDGIGVSLELAVALSIVGRFGEIMDVLEPLHDVVGRLAEPRVAGPYFARMALTRSLLGDHARSEEAARRAQAEAERCGDRATLGMAHYVLAVEGFTTGDAIGGLAHAREAVARMEQAGDRAWLAQACWISGFLQYQLGEFDAAIESEMRMAAIAESLGDQGRQATALWTCALCHVGRGDVVAAEETARRALDLSPDPSNRATAEALLAMAVAEAGDAERAIPLLEEAERQHEPFRLRQAGVTVSLAAAYREAGRIAEARDAALRALEVSRLTSFAWARAAAERELGRVAMVLQDETAARNHLHAALELFRAIPARFEMGRTHLDLARLPEAHDAAVGRRRHLGEALRAFQAARAPRYLDRAERLAMDLRVADLTGDDASRS